MKIAPRSTLLLTFAAVGLAQQPGPNVNVVSHDPFNQKQVEVAAAANPQNPNHVVAGFIDYQTVANENPLLDPTSSAWCGYSFSTNGGKTWKNLLVPGFPGDTSLGGTSSPIFGSNRCGDPAVTWDTNGHVFYMGGAQLPTGPTTLFVARFTDPDDGSGNLNYDTAVAIASGNPSTVGQVPDKPSLAFVPDPTPGGSPSLPGTLYACGTIFNGTVGGKFRNKVMCGISTNSGLTYSAVNQGKINGNVNTNNGTAIAPTPDGGAYVFWRAFLGTENGYWFVKIDRTGNASTPVQVVGPSNFYPYDAPSLPDLARSNAFPSAAVDASGRILLVFQAYSDPTGVMGAPSLVNTPRIFLTYSTDGGATWSLPRAVDYGAQGGNAFQFMPSIAVGGGGLISILYYDARNDGRPVNFLTYLPNGKDRRFDVRVAQGQFNSSGNLSFSPSVQVNTYKISSTTGQVLDRPPGCGGNCPGYNLPNLPIAAGGTVPFIGDYIWMAPAVPFLRNVPSSSAPAWRLANQPGDPSALLALFTSTQDVGFPFDSTTGVYDINGDWTQFVPAGFASCVNPKTRDSNIIFSLISPGISASWSGTSKTFLDSTGNPIPPEFVVTVTNRSNAPGSFRLTIQDNAPTEDWSFVQTPPAPATIPADQNQVDTSILSNSSFSLPVYYRFRSSTNSTPTSPVQVSVQQIDTIGGNVISTGLKTNVTYSTTPVTLQPNNLQPNNLQINNLQPNNLQPNNLQINNLQPNNASPSNLQINNLQINNVQINNTLIPDQDVTWTVSGTGALSTAANSTTNVANGQDLLNAGYQFQLLIYQTQMNPDVSGCTTTLTPTDVILSNIAVTNPNVINVQVNNLQPNNLQPNNTLINDPLASNATFVANQGEQVKVTLRSFRPPTSPPFAAFNQPDQTLGQATASLAANPDGSRPQSIFDFTPPVITPTISGTKGLNGWYVSAVTVTWSVSDPQSGIVLKSGCDPFTQTADTTGVTITCSATNGVGLSTSVPVTIKIDTTPPTVTASISPKSPALTGWYNIATGRPVVTFICTDTGSGVAGTCPAPLVVPDGAKQTITSGVVTDQAGNIAVPVSITGINVDLTPPTITVAPNVGPAPTGWYNKVTGPPTISFTCVDNVSGLAGACPSPVQLSDGANQSVTRSVMDVAGNTGTATAGPFNVDTTPPMITITAPANVVLGTITGTYVLNASVAANYSCSDAVSGLTSCQAPVNSGVNFSTSTVGANAFMVTATDKAGNATSQTNIYAVVYNFILTPPKSPANLGSAVPLIWELTDANGAIISDLSSLVTLASVFNGQPPVNGSCVASLTGTSPTVLYSPATGATGGSNFRFVNPNFQFNWDTGTATGKGCYTVVWQLKDNSTGPPNFSVLDSFRLKLASVQLN